MCFCRHEFPSPTKFSWNSFWCGLNTDQFYNPPFALWKFSWSSNFGSQNLKQAWKKSWSFSSESSDVLESRLNPDDPGTIPDPFPELSDSPYMLPVSCVRRDSSHSADDSPTRLTEEEHTPRQHTLSSSSPTESPLQPEVSFLLLLLLCLCICTFFFFSVHVWNQVSPKKKRNRSRSPKHIDTMDHPRTPLVFVTLCESLPAEQQATWHSKVTWLDLTKRLRPAMLYCELWRILRVVAKNQARMDSHWHNQIWLSTKSTHWWLISRFAWFAAFQESITSAVVCVLSEPFLKKKQKTPGSFGWLLWLQNCESENCFKTKTDKLTSSVLLCNCRKEGTNADNMHEAKYWSRSQHATWNGLGLQPACLECENHEPLQLFMFSVLSSKVRNLWGHFSEKSQRRCGGKQEN